MKPDFDLDMYLVADRSRMSADTLADAVAQAIEGGCTLVQLREKKADTAEFIGLASKIKAVTDRRGVPLIINDRIDVALAVDAAGAHIGSDDMPTSLARKILGEDKILGVSATTLKEAVTAQIGGADYLGVGALFSTATKLDAKAVSLSELARICRSCSLPVAAIGGINEATLPLLAEIPVDGIAVASAVLSSADIKVAARGLRAITQAMPRTQKRDTVCGVEWAIFDLDGTLFNSMGLWERIDVEFLSKRGFSVPPDYINEVSARNFREAALYTKELFDLPENAEYLIEEWRKTALSEYERNIGLKGFAREYLLELKLSGLKLAVATSLPPSLFTPALKRNGIYGLFDGFFSAEEAERGKEYPDFFRDVMRKLDAEPEKCVIFEDVLEAAVSAKAAGAKVCGVFDAYSLAFLADMLKICDFYITDFSRAPELKA